MNNYVIYLRGINVGGKNKIKMADLRLVLDATGFNQVKTYIQKGKYSSAIVIILHRNY